MSSTEPLQIQLLGTFHSQFNGRPIASLNGSPRLQALLAYLLLHRDAPHSRQQIAFQLWPVSGDSQARTNLRKLFLQLRRALPNEDQFLTFDNQTIGWRADAPCTCDLLQVQALLAAVDADPTDRAALTQLLDRYGGELLPDCYDEWVLPLRAELHQDVMAALTQLVTLLENQRAYDDGIRYAQQLLTLEPLAEQGYQQLMRLHAAEGDRAGALKVYQACVDTLARELGVEPSAETQALYQRLRQAKSSAAHRAQPAPVPNLPPLIGRQTEWQTLHAAWQRAMTGRATVVTVAGEAGIGKTRLAEELLQWAEQQGIAAARTRSYQAQGALAYAPITDLLQSEPLRHNLSALDKPRLTQVARLLPDLLVERPELYAPQPMTESWQRQQFFEALAHVFVGDGQPLLLLFDDLQWADGETLSWLHYLLQANRAARLLVVGTVRTGEIERGHRLHTLLHSLQREEMVTQIALTPLALDEVRALAEAVQAGAIADGKLAELYADTEGNPLFVVESVRAQQGAPTTVPQIVNASGLPPKIYSVIRSRLTQLTPETQTLANLAAVVGRSFSYDVLAAASAMAEEEVVDAIDELLARQIIREQSMESYDFSHDRIRDVAYGEISRTRRRLLHRRVAEALEDLHGQDQSPVSGQLAEHHAQAGNHAQAIIYLFLATERALAQFAYGEALRYLARALALVEPSDDATRFRLLDQRLQVHAKQSNLALWHADLMAFEQLVARRASHAATVDHQQQGLLAFHLHTYQQQMGHYQTAIEHAREAVAHAQPAQDLETEAKALLGWGLAAWLSADFDEAKEKLELALARARTAALPAIAATSLERIMQVYMFSGGSARRIGSALDECLALYQQAGDQNGVAAIYNKYGYLPVAQGVGDYEQARHHYERGLALYRQIGNQIGAIGIMRNLGVLYTCCGDYRQAEASLQEALAVEITINRDDFTEVVYNYLGFAYFHGGRLQEAKTAQENALQRLKTNLWRVKALTGLGWIHFYLHETATAWDYLEQALQLCQELNEVRQEGYTRTCMGHLLSEREQWTEARVCYAAALDAHQRMEQPNRAMEPLAGLAWVAQQQGESARALEQVDAILNHLQTHMLDRTEDGFYVYLYSYRILAANRDPRAADLLQSIHDQLQARAATIDDPEHRRLFWEAMPGHREIERAWAQQKGERAVAKRANP